MLSIVLHQIILTGNKSYNTAILAHTLELSGRVLDSILMGWVFQPHRRPCVVPFEQDTLILAKYWFNPGIMLRIFLPVHNEWE